MAKVRKESYWRTPFTKCYKLPDDKYPDFARISGPFTIKKENLSNCLCIWILEMEAV